MPQPKFKKTQAKRQHMTQPWNCNVPDSVRVRGETANAARVAADVDLLQSGRQPQHYPLDVYLPTKSAQQQWQQLIKSVPTCAASPALVIEDYNVAHRGACLEWQRNLPDVRALAEACDEDDPHVVDYAVLQTMVSNGSALVREVDSFQRCVNVYNNGMLHCHFTHVLILRNMYHVHVFNTLRPPPFTNCHGCPKNVACGR